MSEQSPNTGETLDLAWTSLGSALVALCIPIVLYLRTGGGSIFPDAATSIQDDTTISVAYFGLLITGSGLLLLGCLALRYKRQGLGRSGMSWPRFVKIEGAVRDGMVARTILAIFIGVPLIGFAASLVVYAKSRVALWDASAALSDGFFSSRWAALTTTCDAEPCFRMHPLDGARPYAVQWFPWLNEPVLVLMSLAVLAVWARWLMTAVDR